MDFVKHIKTGKMTVNDLSKAMEQCGVFGGGKLGKSISIMEKMIKDQDCTVLMGTAGALVPGGMREIITDFINNKWVDVLVSNGANLVHDTVEALGHRHYQNKEKTLCEKKEMNRIYDSFMKDEVYPDLEKFFAGFLPEIKSGLSSREFLWETGKRLPHGILKACADNKTPIFCPALEDCAIGLQLWNYSHEKDFAIDHVKDLKEIMDIAWNLKKSGVIYIGGGVPKNYIQQSLQFNRPASYAVQITMDRPEHGGSSGAHIKEGISWGKLESQAEYANLVSDATITLPIITAALKERLL